MAGDQIDEWIKEPIPDDARLFMRVHFSYFVKGELIPGVFKDQEGGMSTEWEKYSTPGETQQRARNPQDNGVIELIAGHVRQIDDLRVEHTPDIAKRNRAHTDVYGKKTTEVRFKLLKIYSWRIPVPSRQSL